MLCFISDVLCRGFRLESLHVRGGRFTVSDLRLRQLLEVCEFVMFCGQNTDLSDLVVQNLPLLTSLRVPVLLAMPAQGRVITQLQKLRVDTLDGGAIFFPAVPVTCTAR